MREILFRGKSNNRWAYGDLHHIGDDKIQIGRTYEYPIEYWVNPDTVGQYTGLTDKNGTKIFEGDIVSYKEYVFTVGWFDEYAGFYPFFEQDDPVGYGVEAASCEVIGNIYDNPGLKKKTQSSKNSQYEKRGIE